MILRAIDGESRADFTIDVVCDHRDEPACDAPERLVSVVYHLPRPAGTVGFLEWRAARVVTEGIEQPAALETYWDAVRRLTQGMPREQRNRVHRDQKERDKLLSRNGGRVMGSESWNFKCTDCRMTVPGRYATVHPVFDTLRESAVDRLPLRFLRDRVNA